MVDCLENMNCPIENQHNAVLCEFWVDNIEYKCNPETTCIRDDGAYACCAEDIISCTMSNEVESPTFHPTTIGIYPNSCLQTCDSKYEIEECQWYESINNDNACYDDQNILTCCTHIRSDCCPFRKEGFNNIITVLVVVCILVCILVYYAVYITNKYNKIIQKKNKVAPNFVQV